MKCIQHPGRDAVGICRMCGRGVCPDCARAKATGLTCSERCETRARESDAVFQHSVRVMPTAATTWRQTRNTVLWSAAFFLTIGGIFLWQGYQDYRDSGAVEFALVIGIAMALYGVLTLVRAIRTATPSPYPPGCCRKCGYDLTGNVTGRCPECGREAA